MIIIIIIIFVVVVSALYSGFSHVFKMQKSQNYDAWKTGSEFALS
jgi:uncharacterized protein YpmB